MEIRQPVGLIFSFVSLLHAIALSCALFCNIPWYDKFFLTIAILGYYLYALMRYVFTLSKKSVLSAHRYSDGHWRLQFKDGRSYQAELLNDSLRTRFLSVLNFRVPGKRQRVSIIYSPMLAQPK